MTIYKNYQIINVKYTYFCCSVCCNVAIYYIWKARNCLWFHNHLLQFQPKKKILITSHLSFLGVISPCSGDASWPIYSTLHLPCVRHPFSSIITIFWHSLRVPLIKINRDGLATRPSNFWCYVSWINGAFWGCFMQPLGHHSILKAIELTSWMEFYLESDLSSTLACLTNAKFKLSWCQHIRWLIVWAEFVGCTLLVHTPSNRAI